MSRLHNQIVAIIAVLSIGACSEPPLRLVPYATNLASFAYVPIDLNLDGIVELVGISDQGSGTMTPFDSTGIVMKTVAGRTLDQVNLPGRKISLWVIDGATDPALLAFTVFRDSLHVWKLEMTIDRGQRIDTTAHTSLFRSPVSTTTWDVGVADVAELPSGRIGLRTTTGYAGHPRGVVELDGKSLEVTRQWLSGAKPSLWLADADGYIAVGSHASDNGITAGGLSDSSAWVTFIDATTFRAQSLKVAGRGGDAGVFADSDSTAFVVVRELHPPSASVYRSNIASATLGAELIVRADSIHQVVIGQFIGDAARDIAFSTWSGTLYFRDGTTGAVSGGTSVAYGPVIGLTRIVDLTKDGYDQLFVAASHGSAVYGLSSEPIARGDAELTYIWPLGIADGTFLGVAGGESIVVKMVPDVAAVEARKQFMLFALLFGLALVASNTLVWWLGRRRALAAPRSDLYDYLVLGGLAEQTVVDQLVRVRRALDDHAGESTLSVQRLASLAGYPSSRELNDAVRGATGHTSREMIEQYRLHRAVRLLESSERTIDEIAAAVGFRSHQYFTTRFKKAFGTTPSDYRGNGKA